MTKKLRVLVIDDSTFNRKTITDILSGDSTIEVCGSAADGEQGLKMAAQLEPDLITLDIEMPRMDGFTFLRLIMSQRPTPVIVISSHSRKQEVFQALELGALDFIAKPTRFLPEDTEALRREVIHKVNAVRALQIVRLSERVRPAESRAAPARVDFETRRAKSDPPSDRAATRLVAVGASTGGPPALQTLFKAVHSAGPTAIVVAQHMPEKFTRAFAERLNRLSSIEIQEARDDTPILAGNVYIAPGGAHLEVVKGAEGWRTSLVTASPSDLYVPSIDRLFKSSAKACGAQMLGVVLTGMGADGSDGVKAIKAAGAEALAESAETAIVYGMPKEAVLTGCVTAELPLPAIIERIIGFLQPGQ